MLFRSCTMRSSFLLRAWGGQQLTVRPNAVGSRVPQIAKNRKTACEGLSLLMFAFSVAGNATYVAVRPSLRCSVHPLNPKQSILLQSVAPQHLLINASWLLGSGGTIFLDFIVLGQVRSLFLRGGTSTLMESAVLVVRECPERASQDLCGRRDGGGG